MKTNRRRDKAIIAIAIIALLTTLTVWVFHLKPDWGYMLAQVASTTFRQEAALVEKEVRVSEIPVYEMENSSSFILDQRLMLINKENPIDEEFQPEIVEYDTDGLEMNRCIVKAFGQLSEAVMEECNEGLYVMSAYRMAQEQAEIYNEQGSETAEKPGSSEHQSGLALDVYAKNFAGSAFLKSTVGRYVNSHCWEHGFIIRYPFLKTNVTGIDYEPWQKRHCF